MVKMRIKHLLIFLIAAATELPDAAFMVVAIGGQGGRPGSRRYYCEQS